MILFSATAACLWTLAVGQFQNGIVFDSGVPPTQTSTTSAARNTFGVLTPFIVNQGGCACIPIGTCPPGGAPIIDIRIVNQIPAANTACPVNFGVCCGGTTFPPATSAPIIDATCGIRKIPPQPQPVIGQASFGAYPWQAALLNTGLALIGSGVLLDATHVLTAAHKVAGYVNNVGGLLVRLGEWNAVSLVEPYTYVQAAVARITIHPAFNPNNLENDLAVVRLNGVVNVASYPNVNSACRPSVGPVVGTRCYVSGWGKNLFGPAGSYQSIMREVDVPIVDPGVCENLLRQTRLGAAFVLNRNSFLCAGGEPGKDACTGDGGSPLVCPGPNNQWRVVGLVAWGIGCANPGIPGVYTNVFNFLPWINQVLATA